MREAVLEAHEHAPVTAASMDQLLAAKAELDNMLDVAERSLVLEFRIPADEMMDRLAHRLYVKRLIVDNQWKIEELERQLLEESIAALSHEAEDEASDTDPPPPQEG